MNARPPLVEAATLGALAVATFSGVSVAVAAFGDGAKLSFWTVVAVVLLSYGLARLLGRFEERDQRTMRLLGVAVSLALLYIVLRVEIVGDARLWELGWFADLFLDPLDALEGQAGNVIAVLLLGLAWVYGVSRASREYSFERLLGDMSAWFVFVVVAAIFGPATDAPDSLRWLPVLYLVFALLALALAQLPSTSGERRDSFLQPWALWVGGGIALAAGIASVASLIDPPSFSAIGTGFAFVGRGVGLVLVVLLTPFFIALTWTFEFLLGWLFAGAEPFTAEPTDTTGLGEPDEEEPGRASWVKVFNFVARLGALGLLVAVVLLLLWFSFRRSRRDDDDEVREDVDVEAAGPLGGMRSLFASALDRMRPGGARPRRDAIGRLYTAVLSRAAADGLARPLAATPLEFAPSLDAHFASPLPGAISRAYSTMRYSCRELSPAEAADLASRWNEFRAGGT